jgi:hypothetical protein
MVAKREVRQKNGLLGGKNIYRERERERFGQNSVK